MRENKLPWEGEPDRLEFVDEATGFKCLIRRNRLKAFCGYVIIPEELINVAKNKREDIENLDVHGGVTYFKMKDEDDAPEVGNDCLDSMVGFDCCHVGDLVPKFIEMRKKLREEWSELKPFGEVFKSDVEGTYKDLGFVQSECMKLVKQLHDLLVKGEK